jgi:hypothetical protein
MREPPGTINKVVGRTTPTPAGKLHTSSGTFHCLRVGVELKLKHINKYTFAQASFPLIPTMWTKNYAQPYPGDKENTVKISENTRDCH